MFSDALGGEVQVIPVLGRDVVFLLFAEFEPVDFVECTVTLGKR